MRLDDDQLERLADLIFERLSRPPTTRGPLVDARELARLLGVSRAVIYERSRELGAVRLGTGERARLRFDPELAMQALQPSHHEPPNGTQRRRPPPKRIRKAPKRRPFLEPTALWDEQRGLWRDKSDCPTRDQCWSEGGPGTDGLVAEGPNGERGASHEEWVVARRVWRRQQKK
jgi:hypothetical protein